MVEAGAAFRGKEEIQRFQGEKGKGRRHRAKRKAALQIPHRLVQLRLVLRRVRGGFDGGLINFGAKENLGREEICQRLNLFSW